MIITLDIPADIADLIVVPRRPWDDDAPDGHLESDKDYLLNHHNFIVAAALLDAFIEETG